jgi:uncharacterized protein YfaS (alpha-2-macroglobulin family)
MVEKIHRGDTRRINAWYKNEVTGQYQDPDSGTKEMKIYDPAGALKATVTDVQFTKDSTGKFHYDYAIPTDAAYGDWSYTVKGTLGSMVETEQFFFTVCALKV